MNSNVEFLELMQMARNHMEENNYSYTSVTCYMRTWRSVYNFGLSRGITQYSAELAEQYMLEKYHMVIGENEVDGTALSPYMTQKVRALRALTDFKLHGFVPKITRGEVIKWPDEYKDICTQFSEERKSLGYADQTCRKHELNLYHFACFLHTRDVSPDKIEAVHLYEYFKTLAHYSKAHLVNIRGTLVHSLQFFLKQGVISETLSEHVPRIHYYAKAKINKVWSGEEIEQMLNSIDRANPTGKRDYAIMAIAANLGLRTGDILGMTIENLDWNRGYIKLTQQKTGEPLTLPLSEQIGKAIIDYWMNGRPNTVAKEIFVGHTLPYQKLTPGMVYHMFNKYYESSGVQVTDSRKHGLHSFRHSLASRLLEKDTPVNVIGNILGHVNSDSASTYIQVDIEKLRQCSLEVPDYE
jgi:integrase/recombinase XerD